jgi:hypothetical protein
MSRDDRAACTTSNLDHQEARRETLVDPAAMATALGVEGGHRNE